VRGHGDRRGIAADVLAVAVQHVALAGVQVHISRLALASHGTPWAKFQCCAYRAPVRSVRRSPFLISATPSNLAMHDRA
jgi:hypothetical protein